MFVDDITYTNCWDDFHEVGSEATVQSPRTLRLQNVLEQSNHGVGFVEGDCNRRQKVEMLIQSYSFICGLLFALLFSLDTIQP